MAYNDKDKQRDTLKLATRRYRLKGITKVSLNSQKDTPAVIPETDERTYANAVLCEPVIKVRVYPARRVSMRQQQSLSSKSISTRIETASCRL